MAKIIHLPKLSPTMEEGTLVRWVKNEGDSVEVDDLLAEVETDKATMEFRAFDRGTLLKKLVAEGSTAKLGQPVAILGNPGEDISSLLAQAGVVPVASIEQVPPAPPPSTVSVQAPTIPVVQPRPGGPAPSFIAPTPGVAGIVLLPSRAVAEEVVVAKPGGPASPRVRRLARERGIQLESVVGTGPHGRITLEDLERAARAPRPTVTLPVSIPTARPEDTIKPASQMRKAIARRLTEAKREVPHFYLEADLDVEALVALREQLNEGVEKESRISMTDLFLRACALALRQVPAANASWSDGTIVQHHRVDISLAVAIEDGLVTPVVRDVDRKSLREISAEVRDLAARARARKLKPEEMQGGVFSLSNLGMYGVDRFSAVINPPEGMILAVGAVRDVPVVDRRGQIVPGKRCAVTLSCDHRVIDGAVGAQYLGALRALIEHPVKILA